MEFGGTHIIDSGQVVGNGMGAASALATRSFGTIHPSIRLPKHANIVPIITPLDEDGNPIIDKSILTKYLEHLKALGNKDLFILGETGEFRFLTNEQRLQFAEAIVPLAKQLGFKVYLNATAEEYATTKENYNRFKDLGADAIIFAPLWGNNLEIFEALKNGEFLDGPPIILYNNPGITNGRNIAAGNIKDVAPFIGGLKDSSGDITRAFNYRDCLNTSNTGAPNLYLGDEFLAAQYIHNSAFDGAVGSSGVVSNHLAILYSNDPAISNYNEFSENFRAVMLDISEGRTKMVAGLKEVLRLQNIIPHGRLCPLNSEKELSAAGRLRIAAVLSEQPGWIRYLDLIEQ